jgi:hypothetical protein
VDYRRATVAELEKLASTPYKLPELNTVEAQQAAHEKVRQFRLDRQRYERRGGASQPGRMKRREAELRAFAKMDEGDRGLAPPMSKYWAGYREVVAARGEDAKRLRAELDRATQLEAELRGVPVAALPEIGRTPEKIAARMEAERRRQRKAERKLDVFVDKEVTHAETDGRKRTDAERAAVRRKAEPDFARPPAGKNALRMAGDQLTTVVDTSDRVLTAPRSVAAGLAKDGIKTAGTEATRLLQGNVTDLLGVLSDMKTLIIAFKDYQSEPDKEQAQHKLVEAVLGLSASVLGTSAFIANTLAGSSGLVTTLEAVADFLPLAGVGTTTLTTARTIIRFIDTAKLFATAYQARNDSDDAVLKTAIKRTMQAHGQTLFRHGKDLGLAVIDLTTHLADLTTAELSFLPNTFVRLGTKGIKLATDEIVLRTLKDMAATNTKRVRKKMPNLDNEDAKTLFKTDIVLAADTIATWAKRATPDENAVKILKSYGLSDNEIGRLTLPELRATVLGRLGIDEKLKTTADELKETAKKLFDADPNEAGLLVQVAGAIAEREARIRAQGEVKSAIDGRDRGKAWMAKQRLRTNEQLAASEWKLLQSIQKHARQRQEGLKRKLLTPAKLKKLEAWRPEPPSQVQPAPNDPAWTADVTDAVENPTTRGWVKRMSTPELVAAVADSPITWTGADKAYARYALAQRPDRPAPPADPDSSE